MLSFKKMICCTLTTLTLTMPIVCANVNVPVTASLGLCYVYTKTATSTLTISGTTAKYTTTIVGSAGVTTKIVITQTLQKKNSSGIWTNLKTTTSDSINDYKGSVSNTYSKLAKGTYRMLSTAIVYSGKKSEVVPSYSPERTVK